LNKGIIIFVKKVKAYDLSHKLNHRTPVYPGTGKPGFGPAANLQNEGYRETWISVNSHLGTHIDAPFHMLENGKSLDEYPVDSFMGKAFIIRVPFYGHLITKELLQLYEEKIKKVDFVLFNTGWCKYWGTDKYFVDFPVFSGDAADYLLSFNLKGTGFDTISADPVDSTDYKIHINILERGLIIVENLFFPEELDCETGNFFCLPLPFEKADGSPVRAVLIADPV